MHPILGSLPLPRLAAADGQILADYVPVLVMLMFAVGFAIVLLLLSWALGKKTAGNPIKETAYECGLQPITDAQQRFSVKFYLVALLFVLFDLEVVFLYPWAVIFTKEGPAGFEGNFMLFLLAEMVIFVGILFLGWFYVIRKGVVDWARD